MIVCPGAEARIQQASRIQCVERGAILRQVLRLHAHRPVPVEAQPGQVLLNRGGELGAAAGGIDILDPQQEPAARLARPPPRSQRGERVAEMEIAGGAGGEAGDDGHAGRRREVPSGRTGKGERHGRTGWTALGTRLESRPAPACGAVPRAGRRRPRPDRPRARLGSCAAGRVVRLGRCAVRARFRVRPAVVERCRPLAPGHGSGRSPRRHLPRSVHRRRAGAAAPAGGCLCADGLQPGRDDGALHRACAMCRRRAPSWPSPAP